MRSNPDGDWVVFEVFEDSVCEIVDYQDRNGFLDFIGDTFDWWVSYDVGIKVPGLYLVTNVRCLTFPSVESAHVYYGRTEKGVEWEFDGPIKIEEYAPPDQSPVPSSAWLTVEKRRLQRLNRRSGQRMRFHFFRDSKKDYVEDLGRFEEELPTYLQ